MTIDELRIRQELEATNIAFWRDVDSNWGRTAHEFFAEDGVYTTSQKSRKGREAIRGFYTDRHGRGERVARHLIHNFHVIVHDADHATCEWTMCLYAEDGVAPLLSEPPNIIGVSPAGVDTNFVPGRSRDAVVKQASTAPLKTICQPDDVALAVVAAVTHLRLTTGSILLVDGGKRL